MITGLVISCFIIYAIILKWYDIRLDRIEKRIIKSLHVKKEKKSFLSRIKKDKEHESND